MKKIKFIWVTLVPMIWLVIITFTSGLIKVLDHHYGMAFMPKAVTIFFLLLVATIIVMAVINWWNLITGKIKNELKEMPIVWLNDKKLENEKVEIHVEQIAPRVDKDTPRCC